MCIIPIRIKLHGVERKVACGKCDECRKAFVNQWTERLKRESKNWLRTSFCTLTIKYDALTDSNLYRKFLQDMFKRLRHKQPFKYYLVAEHGDETNRLHSHMVLFSNHSTNFDVYYFILDEYEIGFISVGDCTPGGMYYTINYLTEDTDFRLISKGIGREKDNKELFNILKDEKYPARYYKDRFKKQYPRIYKKYEQYNAVTNLVEWLSKYNKRNNVKENTFEARWQRHLNNEKWKSKKK